MEKYEKDKGYKLKSRREIYSSPCYIPGLHILRYFISRYGTLKPPFQ